MSSAIYLVPLAIQYWRKKPTRNEALSTKIAIIKPMCFYSVGSPQSLTEALFFLKLYIIKNFKLRVERRV